MHERNADRPRGKKGRRVLYQRAVMSQKRPDTVDEFLEGFQQQCDKRLALVTVMQFRENLSDRQAAEAVRARIDWKYLLGLELSDAGFDKSVLSEFRHRLLTMDKPVSDHYTVTIRLFHCHVIIIRIPSVRNHL
jgi:hypothetical protein